MFLLTTARSLGLLIATINLAPLGLGTVPLTVALRFDGLGTCFRIPQRIPISGVFERNERTGADR